MRSDIQDIVNSLFDLAANLKDSATDFEKREDGNDAANAFNDYRDEAYNLANDLDKLRSKLVGLI